MKRLLFPLLFIAVLAAYRPAWHGEMVWDDDAHITRSELRSLHGLQRIWFDLGATQQYYPLVHSVFWLQSRTWGGHTLGYHVLNIGVHALSAFLVIVVLRRLRVPGAELAGFVFALHPVHVESVAWMSELKNTLSGALYLGAALVYLRFDERRQRHLYGIALALFVLALLSKSVTATLPAGLLVILWWQRGTLRWRRDALPLIPFFAIGAAAGLMTAWVERTFIGAQGSEFNLTAIERFLVAGRAILFYIGKLIWPANLIFMYPRWEVREDIWWQYLFPIGVAGLLGGLWLLRRRSRAPLAAMLYFCVTVFPALGFVNVYPFRYSFVADHFQYLASIGIITLAAAALVQLVRRWNTSALPAAAVQPALIVMLGVPLAILTWNQSRQYVNAETLYVETLRRNPQCWLAHENLGVLRLDGTEAGFRKAAAHFQEALRINPREPQVHNNLGTTWMQMGRLEDAVREHRLAIQYAPGYAEAYGNLGAALQQLGRFEEAADAYRQALAIKPVLTVARVNLAVVLHNLKRTDEAGAELREAAKREENAPAAPSAAATSTNLGDAYAATARFAEAVTQYEAALRAGPDSPQTRAKLGHALWRAGRLDEAAAHLREALRLNPDDAGAHANLGNVFQAAGRLEEAVAEYSQAIRLKPRVNAAEIHNDMGVALARLGRYAEAVEHFREAVRLKPDFDAARANLAKALAAR